MNGVRQTSQVRLLAVRLVICTAIVACSCQTLPQQDPLLRIPRGAATGYNVLLITLDTTRADRLGCYGYARAR